jgi:hypothetical protein
MANYVLLYSGGKMPDSPAEQAAVLKEWEAWFGKIGGALVDGGTRLPAKQKASAATAR